MPRISRHKDRCRTGHACSSTAPVNASQRTVFANGRSILVRGDRVAPHFILKGRRCLGHKAILSGSSRRVFIRGIGVGRRGDKADKGAMVGASFDVFAG
tara:strand:+ start:81 stop:377 length:297 start_codon:yes stop_codon:yes gene_type:complete